MTKMTRKDLQRMNALNTAMDVACQNGSADSEKLVLNARRILKFLRKGK